MKPTSWSRGLFALALPLALAACVEKETVQVIPDAENILFTSNQKLIVSGGENIYEISEENGEIGKRELFAGHPKVGKHNCNFTGIAQHENWLISSCVSTKFLIFKNNHLLAANLDEPDFEFEIITNPSDLSDPYDTLVLPNGIAFAPDDALLVADYNLFGDSGVARVELDFSGDTPTLSSLEKNFVSPAIHGVSSPNGVRVVDNKLFVSDGNSVKRFQFDAASNIPEYIQNPFGESEKNGKTIWSSTLAIVDDIMPYCDGIAFTSYLSGRLHYSASYTDASGMEHFPVIYSSPPLAFESPSAMAFGSIPGLVDTTSLLVTEKGLLQEKSSSLGNKLVSVPLTMDLDDPNACNLVADLAREAIEG